MLSNKVDARSDCRDNLPVFGSGESRGGDRKGHEGADDDDQLGNVRLQKVQ